MIELSIIIPTIGRTDDLVNLFTSLESGLDNIVYEILVIDQNSDSRLDDIVERFTHVLSIKHYKVNFKGLSKAKNFGVKNSLGQYIAFPDDDCKVFPNTFKNSLTTIKEKKANIVFGKCIDEKGNDSIVKFKEETAFLDVKNMNGRFVEPTTLVEKKVFTDYLFDEDLGAGMFFGAEEGFDWLYRILRDEKFSAYYDPNIIFYHPQVIQTKGDEKSLRRVFSYSCGKSYLCKKHHLLFMFFKQVFISLIGISIYFFTKKSFSKYYRVQLYGLLVGYELANLKKNAKYF